MAASNIEVASLHSFYLKRVEEMTQRERKEMFKIFITCLEELEMGRIDLMQAQKVLEIVRP